MPRAFWTLKRTAKELRRLKPLVVILDLFYFCPPRLFWTPSYTCHSRLFGFYTIHADVDWHFGDVCPSPSAVSVRRIHVVFEACPHQLTTEACQVTGANYDWNMNEKLPRENTNDPELWTVTRNWTVNRTVTRNWTVNWTVVWNGTVNLTVNWTDPELNCDFQTTLKMLQINSLFWITMCWKTFRLTIGWLIHFLNCLSRFFLKKKLRPMVILHAIQCQNRQKFNLIIEKTDSEVHNVQQNSRILLWV